MRFVRRLLRSWRRWRARTRQRFQVSIQAEADWRLQGEWVPKVISRHRFHHYRDAREWGEWAARRMAYRYDGIRGVTGFRWTITRL